MLDMKTRGMLLLIRQTSKTLIRLCKFIDRPAVDSFLQERILRKQVSTKKCPYRHILHDSCIVQFCSLLKLVEIKMSMSEDKNVKINSHEKSWIRVIGCG